MNPILDAFQSIPRFLACLELLHLYEAAKASDAYLAAKLPDGNSEEDVGMKHFVNATRQSLLRSIFISSFAVVEQNIDAFVVERAKIKGTSLRPSDLRGKGIKRSLHFANKVLEKKINLNAAIWVKLLLVQDLRNHLVHYGPDFEESGDHKDRIARFSTLDFVTPLPLICFTTQQLEHLFGFYVECIRELQRS